MLCDRWEISVLEGDGREPLLPPLERVEQAESLRAGNVAADELAEVALPSDEADQRGGAISGCRLDELRDLGRLLGNECLIGETRHEPKDELVEEKHDC